MPLREPINAINMFISELQVYPVKGCGGVLLGSAVVDEYGLKGDRKYMVVDEQSIFFSQRKHPIMSQIRVSHVGGFFSISFTGSRDLIIEPQMEANELQVRIWDDDVVATDMGDPVSLWFSQVLGQKVRLVTIGAKYNRNVQVSDTVYSSKMHFGDSCPILVTTTASLDDLNSRLSEPVPMDRFRPNMVIDGAYPYEEDTWKYIRIGDQLLQFAKKCGRCTVTTIDQDTGESGMEPLATLAQYRKDGTKVCFGSYYIPINTGSISVGDRVVVKR
jgi:uncharacterized protein YcbX